MTSKFEVSHQSEKKPILKSLVKGRGVSLKFENRILFNDCNFDLFEGESVVLIGPSGQGKTSLLKIMAGLLEATSGTVEFEGENWSKLSITQRNYHFQKRGMLFQKNALFDSLTVFDNVCFPLREKKLENELSIREKAKSLLSAVGLQDVLQLYPEEISGGMQKRLGIARAMISKPPILLNDDPVAGLDPISSRKIIELILNLKKENSVTLVSVLNDMNRAFELATRLIFVTEDGAVSLGSPREARQFPDPIVQRFIKGQTG